MVAFLALLPLFQSQSPLPIYLLGSPEVRRDLDVSHEASVRIKDLITRVNRLESGGVMTTQEAAKRDEERKRTPPETLLHQAEALLTLAQKQRLRQYRWQQSEPWILGDAEAVRLLGASADQVSRSQRFQAKAYRDYRAILDRADRYRTAHHDPKSVEVAIRMNREAGIRYRLQCDASLHRILTSKQEKVLKTLLGRPFPIDKVTYDVPPMIID